MMKLRQLQAIVNQCVINAGNTNPDVEVWFKKRAYDIRSVDQFGVIPTVTITIGECTIDLENWES